jgi:hypothetical protein
MAVSASACSLAGLRGASGTPTPRLASLKLPPSPTEQPPQPTPTAGSPPLSATVAVRPPRPTSAGTPQPATRVITLGQLVTLRPTIEVVVGGTSSTLIFEGIEQDSRCPSDVTCIQAGSVTALFDAWDGRAAHREAITLPATDGTGRARLGALEVTLHAVEPAPLSTRAIRPFDYRAVVSVERLAGTPGATATPVATVAPTATVTPAATVTPVAQAAPGIDGLVTLGPMCPVQRADQPCPDRPYEATLVIRTATGASVGRVQSDVNGRFAIDLPGGRYIIEPQLVGPARLPFASPQEVIVPSGGRAFVTIPYDTGIR